jgi:glycosyltransferase involved in cell wall biosynthesis
MRVLYISHGDVPSKWAHSFQSMKMAEALASRARSVTLLTRGSVLPSAIHQVDLSSWYATGPGVRTLRLPIHWRVREPFFAEANHPRFDRLATLYARLTRPDLVYARSTGAGRRCVVAGLPTLIEVHGNPSRSPVQRERFERLRQVVDHPSLLGIVTVTEFLRDQYADLGFPASKLFVWPDAVDPKLFRAAPGARVARQQLGLPQRGTVATYTGSFSDEKGVPCLLEAAARLPRVLFCLIGGWPRDVEAMRRRAQGLANVRFEGFVPYRRIPDYLAASDLVVLPNSGRTDAARATSPLKLFEYMASGRAIVASDIPAFGPLLRDGENAHLVEPDRAECLAQGLATLADNPAARRRLARQAQIDVRPFTWERRAQAILDHFAIASGTVDAMGEASLGESSPTDAAPDDTSAREALAQ